MNFYAHSVAGRSKEVWQKLSDHLYGVGSLAARNAAGFGGQALAEAAGLLHDLGKYTDKFQQRLEGGGPVDHSTWGAHVAIEQFGRLYGQLLAYVIAGHHAGLANGMMNVSQKRTCLDERLAGELPQLLDQWRQDVVLPESGEVSLPGSFQARKERGMFQLSLLVRMIFSCLV